MMSTRCNNESQLNCSKPVFALYMSTERDIVERGWRELSSHQIDCLIGIGQSNKIIPGGVFA